MTGENELLGSDPAISGGALCVAGTRIRVSVIQSFAEIGYSPEAIQREYPTLSLEQIEAATAYKPSRPSPVVGEAVAWRWRNKPDGVWNYQEARQRIPGVEQEPLYAAPSTIQTGGDDRPFGLSPLEQERIRSGLIAGLEKAYWAGSEVNTDFDALTEADAILAALNPTPSQQQEPDQ